VEPPSKKFLINRVLNSYDDPEVIEGKINQLGHGCITNISIPLSKHSPFLQTKGNKLTLTALADTGADINVISSRIARGLVERGEGVVGKGKYRIIDAFKTIRIFDEHITFNLTFDDISNKDDQRIYTIIAVIIDTPS
jgi:hypothetical protein